MGRVWILLLLALAAAAHADEFVGSAARGRCRGDAFAAWRNSHHDLAMQRANVDSVLGNFENAQFT